MIGDWSAPSGEIEGPMIEGGDAVWIVLGITSIGYAGSSSATSPIASFARCGLPPR